MMWAFQCQGKCLKKTTSLGYITDAFGEEICCLCTSYRFGSYIYAVLMALFGIVLTVTDICRTVTNGPLPVCNARKDNPYNRWFLCPRLERDLSLMGSFFNLLMYILLLVGLLAERPTLMLPWLAYKAFLVCALILIYLAHLVFIHTWISKWELLILAFNMNNILQVMCVFISLH